MYIKLFIYIYNNIQYDITNHNRYNLKKSKKIKINYFPIYFIPIYFNVIGFSGTQKIILSFFQFFHLNRIVNKRWPKSEELRDLCSFAFLPLLCCSSRFH